MVTLHRFSKILVDLGIKSALGIENTRSKLNSQSEIQLSNPQGWTPNFSSECCPFVQKFKIRQKLKHVDLGYRSHGLENSSGGDSGRFSKTTEYEQILSRAEIRGPDFVPELNYSSIGV